MKNIVVIPSYKPDVRLIELVDKLAENELGIVVVNDGSGTEYDEIFAQVMKKAKVVVLPVNCGKGFALKCGITTVMREYEDCEHFVTADSDGQHKPEDIMRVFNELENGAEFVLTVRKFRKNMPFRSKIGNDLSRFIYTILNGHYFLDNQSGLRGFNIKQAEWLVRIDGNKYDYEMNMLYYADKQGVMITTIPIEAIYIDNNASSHFHPIKDTVRIYAQLFYSARMSFAAKVLMELMLFLISFIFHYHLFYITIPLIGATEIIFKIIMNKYVVLRRFNYKDLIRTVIVTTIRYGAYTLGTLAIAYKIPAIPLFVSFNFIMMLCIPAEYYLRKLTYLSRYNDVNKER